MNEAAQGIGIPLCVLKCVLQCVCCSRRRGRGDGGGHGVRESERCAAGCVLQCVCCSVCVAVRVAVRVAVCDVSAGDRGGSAWGGGRDAGGHGVWESTLCVTCWSQTHTDTPAYQHTHIRDTPI